MAVAMNPKGTGSGVAAPEADQVDIQGGITERHFRRIHVVPQDRRGELLNLTRSIHTSMQRMNAAMVLANRQAARGAR